MSEHKHICFSCKKPATHRVLPVDTPQFCKDVCAKHAKDFFRVPLFLVEVLKQEKLKNEAE